MPTTFAKVRGFTLTRILNAPVDLVWRAWTDPEYLDWFFNPATSSVHPTTVELRPGGAWRQHMVIDGKTNYVTGGIYKEIVPQRRLVFAWGAIGGWPNLDDEYGPEVTVELSAMGERTRMDFQLQLPGQLSEPEVDAWMTKGIDKGWTGTLDRLVERLVDYRGKAA